MISSREKWIWRAVPAAILGLLAVWAADRSPPVEQHINQAEGLAVAGGEAIVTSMVTRRRLCETEIGIVFRDARGSITIMPPKERTPEVLGLDSYNQSVPIPASAAAGQGRIVFTLKWRCNPSHLIWPITDTIRVPVVVERRN